ncbi:MAG TPA: metalloregulator ArsR/SmtB family transcription factor [Candidatus Micrarchaeia archaeon]|nr:metalloregulator ArsR/SmtB family transcription factor [Candidatus Micrarchaeia archaeon]
MELLWLGHKLLHRGAQPPDALAALGDRRAGQLAERLRTFWGDEVSGGVGELVIVADQAGLLFTTDLGPLLGDLPSPDGDPGSLGLRSEDPADRQRFADRLRRLQRDPATRRRYAELLHDIWSPFQPEWERRGLPLMLEACDRLRRHLQSGAALEEAVPAIPAIAGKRPEWGPLIREATSQGRLALTPGYFGGRWSIWDLPVHVLVGYRPGELDPLAETRAAASRLAPRLKVLGDATRLAILLSLSDQPASIGEVATRFGLAQPTVSAHFRLLREAGLLGGTREDGRTRYRVERGRLGDLIHETARSVGVDLDG